LIRQRPSIIDKAGITPRPRAGIADSKHVRPVTISAADLDEDNWGPGPDYDGPPEGLTVLRFQDKSLPRDLVGLKLRHLDAGLTMGPPPSFSDTPERGDEELWGFRSDVEGLRSSPF
jgi:hypothetical protein